MTLERFRELAETWGGDIHLWPAAEQSAALQLARTAEAARVLEEQSLFDIALASAPEVSEDRVERAAFAVLQRIAGQTPRMAWHRRLLQPAQWLPAATLACSALLGIWLAGSLPFRDQDISVVALVFDNAAPFSMWVVQ